MVIHDLDLLGTTVAPLAAQAPLVVDPDTVLSPAISTQRLQMVAGRRGQLREPDRGVELPKFSQGDSLKIPITLYRFPLVQLSRFQ